MILPYQTIVERLEDEDDDFDIKPVDPEQLQPASVDLRLGNEVITFRKMNIEAINPRDDPREYGEEVTIDDSYVIKPGEFILGETREWMHVPDDLVAFVHGRSSWARLAIQPHAAGLLDSGWNGYTTLEIFNLGPMPVHLHPGTRFCQVTFERLVEATERPYEGKYQGQKGVEMSRIDEDVDI